MSEVSIDPSSLELEADLIAAEHAAPVSPAPGEVPAPGVVTDGPGPSLEEVQAGYQVITDALIDRGADAFAPAWNIQREEKQSLSAACAKALVLWFPDQIIPPKYMALLVVAGVTMEIVGKRRDPATGELKPRHHAKPKPPVEAPAPTTAQAA